MFRLLQCPLEKGETANLYTLPNEVMLLPKSHTPPEPKPETKWEKFAKEKGIKKTKKERMVSSSKIQNS